MEKKTYYYCYANYQPIVAKVNLSLEQITFGRMGEKRFAGFLLFDTKDEALKFAQSV